MSRVRGGIVNVTGYAGVELARLLLRHPEVELTQVTGRSAAGQRLQDVFPHLGPTALTITAALDEPVDVAFLALPHKEAAQQVPALLGGGVKVVDISADFRLKDAAVYEQWYGAKHPVPELLGEAVYGLPELYAGAVSAARLIANPGCYPTSAILALAPIMDIIEPDVIIDSKSGVSGAGRALALNVHFSEINENCHAYGLSGHRHLPEIAQELRAQRARAMGGDGGQLAVTFVPHLVPMTRGILSTCYVRALGAVTTASLRELYVEFYRQAPFVGIAAAPPQTKQTLASNRCLVYPLVDDRTGRIIVVSCLDNLVKGAAGQAVQNMNLMFGFPESEGIDLISVYP